MLLEAVDHPIRYTWPEGEIHLEPGKPLKISDERRALKVLAKCGSKVRKVSLDWLGAWDELAQMTDGIEKTDDRFGPVMAVLDQCDRAFENDDWGLFREGVAEVKRLMTQKD